MQTHQTDHQHFILLISHRYRNALLSLLFVKDFMVAPVRTLGGPERLVKYNRQQMLVGAKMPEWLITIFVSCLRFIRLWMKLKMFSLYWFNAERTQKRHREVHRHRTKKKELQNIFGRCRRTSMVIALHYHRPKEKRAIVDLTPGVHTQLPFSMS